MFRAQQNAFDDAVGERPADVFLLSFGRVLTCFLCFSQGDRREPHLGELGIYSCTPTVPIGLLDNVRAGS